MKKYILILLLLSLNIGNAFSLKNEELTYKNTYKTYNISNVNSKLRYEKLLQDYLKAVVSYKSTHGKYPIFKKGHIIMSDNDKIGYQYYFITGKNVGFSYSVSFDGKFFQIDKIGLFEYPSPEPISVKYYRSENEIKVVGESGYLYTGNSLFSIERMNDWVDGIVISKMKKNYYGGGGGNTISSVSDDSIAIITEDGVFRLKSDNKFYSGSILEGEKLAYGTGYALFSSVSKKVYGMDGSTLGVVISRASTDYIYGNGLYKTMDSNTYANEYSFSGTNYAKRVSDSKLLNHSDFSVFGEYKTLDMVKNVVIRAVDSKIFETNGQEAFFNVCKSGCDYSSAILGDNTALSNAINAINTTELKKIKILTGSYTLSSTLNINTDNASIEGLGTGTTSIFGAYGKDVFKWMDGSDNGSLRNMTVNSRYNGAQAVFAAGKVSGMVIDNINAIGSNISNSFVIYFAGPNHATGVPYTDASSAWSLYSGSTGSLTVGNQIINSDIDFNLNSDAVVFAFSSGAILKNNNIKGKLAYYLSQHGTVEGNNFYNSLGESIAVSTPVNDLLVQNNTFTDIGGSAMLVKPQVEHDMNPSNYGSGITFSGNTINNVGGFGIAFSNSAPLAVNSKFENISIIGNDINETHDSGIYFLCRNADDDYCNNINTSYNTITNPNSANQGGYWDSGITFEDRYKDNNLIQGLRNVSFIGNTIADNRGSPYMGFGIRFEYPGIELPTLSGNTITGFKHGDKNF